MTNRTKERPHVFALILAGGAGARMQGADKGLKSYNGKPLIEHVALALAPQVDEVIISANRNLDDYLEYAGLVLPDDQQEKHEGPMAGISSVLAQVSEMPDKTYLEYCLVSSCDTPNLPTNLFETLLNAINDDQGKANIAVVHDGLRRQHLHCLIHRSKWQSLVDAYLSGVRALYSWHDAEQALSVDFSKQADAFLNINAIDQLA